MTGGPRPGLGSCGPPPHGHLRRVLRCRPALLLLAAGVLPLPAAPSLESVAQAVAGQDLPRAERACREILAAAPGNAEANFTLGSILARGHTAAAYTAALVYLQQAADLDPRSSRYIAEYGGISFLLAGETRSLTAATHGRDAMIRAIALDPDNLDARDGLMQFYFQAPWPIGSTAKAMVQLKEIRRRDFNRGTRLLVEEKLRVKNYAEAFQACAAVLARDPRNPAALLGFGRTADLAGTQVEQGLACLEAYLGLGAAAADPAAAWEHLGGLQEKLGHRAAAARAFAQSLQLDPRRAAAAAGLARVRG